MHVLAIICIIIVLHGASCYPCLYVTTHFVLCFNGEKHCNMFNVKKLLCIVFTVATMSRLNVVTK